MFNRILIPVNDGEQSDWAIEAAAEFLKEHPATVALLHIVDTSPVYAAGFAYADTEIHEKRQRSGKQLLERAAACMPPSIVCEQMLHEGPSPSAVIDEVARSWHADLIFMGTHGRGRITQFLIGSTTESVVRDAPCPVMLVRQPVGTRMQGRSEKLAAVSPIS